MSEILIIARTRMKHGNICVGAIDTGSFRFLRLMNSSGYAFTERAPFQVGETWEIGFVHQIGIIPPHVEDVRVFSMRRAGGNGGAGRWLRANADRMRLWSGPPHQLYDGALTFPRRLHADAHRRPRAPYVERGDALPTCSLGLWVTDRLLVRREERREGLPRMRYECVGANEGNVSMSVPHVGYGPTPLVLPPGSIVSLSLTRWWAPPDTRHIPERCYVQICDVVDVPAKPTAPVVHAEDALSDVPF